MIDKENPVSRYEAFMFHVRTFNASRIFARDYNDAIAMLNPGKWVGVYGESVVSMANTRQEVIDDLIKRGLDVDASVIRQFRARQRAKPLPIFPQK